ncbi:arsenate reductase (glutaredoxin) [Nitriliruptor alkaliphilus]|uniref:arsenate reductase (glutaredoxin) n=1 Tax=Nitriliruptor alkaliphilus TaxID=427918 RepID=UPI00069600F9|nr:arsenate reductase (glutaredoxin) [Nitriliruptor alkaliphilus]
MAEATVWHNARCSKSRGALALLEERGVDVEVRTYLTDPPTRAEVERLLEQLGTDDPRTIVRTGEQRYRELGLRDADRDELIAALTAEPVLLERPVIVHRGRAVVGRPPERVLELLDLPDDPAG